MRRAVAAKYFSNEAWEDAYQMATAEENRMAKYAGCSLLSLQDLPLSLYLLIKKDSWIESMHTSEESREVLATLWRLQQTKADLKKIREKEVEK